MIETPVDKPPTPAQSSTDSDGRPTECRTSDGFVYRRQGKVWLRVAAPANWPLARAGHSTASHADSNNANGVAFRSV